MRLYYSTVRLCSTIGLPKKRFFDFVFAISYRHDYSKYLTSFKKKFEEIKEKFSKSMRVFGSQQSAFSSLCCEAKTVYFPLFICTVQYSGVILKKHLPNCFRTPIQKFHFLMLQGL